MLASMMLAPEDQARVIDPQAQANLMQPLPGETPLPLDERVASLAEQSVSDADAQARLRVIGEWLNAQGGIQLMQSVFREARRYVPFGFRRRYIDGVRAAWIGVGRWQG